MTVQLIRCKSNKTDEDIIEIINVLLNLAYFNKDNKMKWFKQMQTDEKDKKQTWFDKPPSSFIPTQEFFALRLLSLSHVEWQIHQSQATPSDTH